MVAQGAQSLPAPSDFPPPVEAMGVCAANPRTPLGSPPFQGVSGNTAMLLLYLADLTPGTKCPWNITGTVDRPALVLCNGALISPVLMLTAAQCLKGDNIKAITGCEKSELVDVEGE